MSSVPKAAMIAGLVTAILTQPAPALAGDGAPSAPLLRGDVMRILTYPTGLVLGKLEVNVDLGPEARPADLFLNGDQVCSLTDRETSCTVDLGADPHVHLLELVRGDGARTERWVNRPGQEAELFVLPLEPAGSGPCQARIGWVHPERQSPVELEVILPGAQPEISDGGRSVSFPCPPPGHSQTLVAMAVFPDGRRVESTAVIGGFADQTAVELHALPLVAAAETECRTGAEGWPQAAEKLEKSGFEVVIVLDPEAHYMPLRNSGWNTGRLAATSGASTKVFDRVVRSGPRQWAGAQEFMAQGEGDHVRRRPALVRGSRRGPPPGQRIRTRATELARSLVQIRPGGGPGQAQNR